MKRLLVKVLACLLALVALSGCYVNKQVEQHQVGVKMDDGVSITAIAPPGRYSKWTWFADLQTVDVSAKTITWEDPDMVTRDKQPVGFALAVTYRRKNDSESVRAMWTEYHSEAINDQALEALVRSRIPRAAKAASTQFSLDEMLADRNSIQVEVEEVLLPELADTYVELLDVGVSNIAPSPMYIDKLEEKAAAQIAVEVAQERTKELEEQLNQEKAQTEIDLEKARRERLVKEALAEIYDVSPEVYELERLKLLRDVLSGETVYFIPESGRLNLLLGDDGGVAPIITTPDEPYEP